MANQYTFVCGFSPPRSINDPVNLQNGSMCLIAMDATVPSGIWLGGVTRDALKNANANANADADADTNAYAMCVRAQISKTTNELR